jgi:alpha-amylase/alpha-mannosidase (GH57 family)
MHPIHHALVLNLHQPAGNLDHLLEHNEWEAREILFAFDRIPRSLWEFEDVARVHLALSGTLLETLASPQFQSRTYGMVDCGSLLWHLQNRKIFEILGTGYYHPVLPLIPEPDRAEQILRWQGLGRHLFWRDRFDGFWAPEMGFSMELIPLLQRFGYRYVLVDSEHVRPVTPMGWEELRYRPHVARHGDAEIIVVVRDRELSNAQESGMDLPWFDREVRARTKWCEFPPLVTTCTDGENGGWFRNASPEGNFWGAFYRALLARARDDANAIRPSFISDYLARHGAHGEVEVRTGAWNTGWHNGIDFTQWTGSLAQRRAVDRVRRTSRSVHDARWRAGEMRTGDPACDAELEQAMWRVLRAETSCHLYWGEAWVERCHSDLDAAEYFLHQAEQRLPER